MNLILLGAPGAGKGTQAEILSQKLGVPAISTGNILRAAVRNGTPTGLKAKEYMDTGRLVPDELIISIIAERLGEPDCANGFILDGVPRTIAQADALEAAGVKIHSVFLLEVPDKEIVKRLTGRRTCPNCGATYHQVNNPPKQEGICDKCGTPLVQRKDDLPETVQSRLAVYHKETAPLEDYYKEKGILYMIENQPSIVKTAEAILEALGIKA